MLTQALDRLGRAAARRPWRVIAAWLLLAVAAAGASAALGGRTTDTISAPGVDAQHAADLLARGHLDQAGVTAQVVVTPAAPSTPVGSGDAGRALAALEQQVRALPHVLGTATAISPDGRVALLRVQYPELRLISADDLHALVAVRAAQPPGSPVRVELGGDLFTAFSDSGANTGELVGLLVAATILLFAFGSLVAALLPVGMAVLGLTVGIGVITSAAAFAEISSMATILGAMVGLGVGIDYALFVLARHREHLAAGHDVPAAAGLAVANAGRPVVFAGGTVVVSILGLAVAGVPFITVGAFGVALVVLIMVAASVTLLPAFLGVARHRVLGRRTRAATPVGSGWRRWITHVTRHPLGYGAGATVLLLAAAAPALALRAGLPDDGSMPPSSTQRRAYDLVAQGFGAGSNGPLVVAVDPAADPALVGRAARALAADPGVASVAPARVDPATGIAGIVVVPTTGPQQEATQETVVRLRERVLPAVVHAPARASVGGAAAMFSDVGQLVDDRLPALVAAVLALSFVLLTLLFRSVVLPLKAVVLNLLSIGAAYGVLVMVFQWGWGLSLLGLDETVPIVSYIPMFMFAVLFGLSMDYEVFLLSRVREEYLAGGNTRRAVVDGISGTARVITSAAAVMVAVFLAFATDPNPMGKMFGLGLATAILVDATVVRMVLVPAAMTLLGRANWYLPRWLDRRLPGAPPQAGERPAPQPASPVRTLAPSGQ